MLTTIMKGVIMCARKWKLQGVAIASLVAAFAAVPSTYAEVPVKDGAQSAAKQAEKNTPMSMDNNVVAGKASLALEANGFHDISVTAKNGVVALHGSVKNAAARDRAIKLVEKVSGVTEVVATKLKVGQN